MVASNVNHRLRYSDPVQISLYIYIAEYSSHNVLYQDGGRCATADRTACESAECVNIPHLAPEGSLILDKPSAMICAKPGVCSTVGGKL